jgi:hypothetical protein
VVSIWLEGCEVETVWPDGWCSAFVLGGENWRRCLVVAGCGSRVGGGRGIWERWDRSMWEREEKIKRISVFISDEFYALD